MRVSDMVEDDCVEFDDLLLKGDAWVAMLAGAGWPAVSYQALCMLQARSYSITTEDGDIM